MVQSSSKRTARYVFLLGAILLLPLAALATEGETEESFKPYGAEQAKKVVQAPERWITADHSKHEALKKEFTSGPEVTKACLTCHNEAAVQMHETIHWTWICPADPSNRMGKAGLTLNNFCIHIAENEPRCTSCHAGYGWKDKSFDFTAEDKVDCLVCHDQTGTYKKFPTLAGKVVSEPKKFGNKTFFPPDWNKVAQSVGRPNRNNCGTCHFYGGGGDGVKHGDLDSSMNSPSKDLDVHMNAEGADFTCVRCHTTKAHKIAGRCYKKPAFEERKSLIDDDLVQRISCESCHTAQPHKPGVKANDHTDKVACQSCHIPTYARVLPTKMWWDWSKAGRKKDGKPIKKHGNFGKHSYVTKKGEFRWDKNVVPEYFWFNGGLDYVLITDTIDPTKPVKLNRVQGSKDDPKSRIYPFKVHRGKQPFDTESNSMVAIHLFSPKESDAYWGSYDWNTAIRSGMEYLGLDYSGEYGFVETEYHFPITHMVAPKDNVLKCEACHSRNGRLANLAGFYMPGRDRYITLDILGWILVFGSLAAVLVHGIIRAATKKKGEEA